MNRATWLQDRRMLKFRDVLSRWERRELSMVEAGELLGMSERQFRRYRERFEDDGEAGDMARRTDVGCALDRDGVENVPAYAPDPTTCSGRKVDTLQDQVVKEHKLAGGNNR